MWKALACFIVLAVTLALYGARSTGEANACAFSVTPTTYEGPQDRSGYLLGLELAGFNQIAPANPSFSISPEERGPRGNRSLAVYPYVPPKLLKSIAFIESNLWNASSSTPYRGVGPALVSFDCGHGLAQVTSGMTHPLDNGWPSHNQSLIATHYLYNIARGSNILVSKWNAAPEVRPVAANGDPRVIESWYYALWSYNGFAFQNHPYLPNPSAWPRTGYSCSSNLSDGYSHSRTGYPYQELVLGCAARPPSIGGQRLWSPLGVNLPNLNDPAFDGLTSLSAWQACAGSSSCAAMDIPLPWINHKDSTPPRPAGTASFVIGGPRLKVSTNYRDGPGNVVISNTGGGILPWRATGNHSWLGIDRQAGVALSPFMTCTNPCDRNPALKITVASNAPPGALGSVTVTNLITGNSQWILVRAPTGPAPTPTSTSTPAPSPTPSSSPAVHPFGDSDWDGCINHFEVNNPPERGGGRDPNNFWDFFDTPDSNNHRDRRINAADVYRVWLRLGTSGNPSVPAILPPPPTGYHPAFDRGSIIGPNPWNVGPPDGSITAVDLLIINAQAGHDCRID
jgi:hypothetical protein